MTATLIAGVVIGQIGITINQPLKAFAFLMFLFAVGYGVGPQFVRGIARDGVPQAAFSAVQCVLSLITCVVVVKIVGYDLGYAAGFYSGSQTLSAAMGLSTDAINRLGLAPEQAKALIDSMPIAYAVTYMFGTMGSAVVIAIIGPKLLGIDLEAACKDYEEKFGGGKKELGGAGSAWHRWVLRAYKVRQGGKAAGMRAARPNRWCPTRASSSSACAATARSSTRPPTPCSRRATWSRSRASAKCSSGCCRRRRKSTTRSCSRCRWRASTSW